MDDIMNLLCETTESAFLFRNFLYAICFLGDSVLSKVLDSKASADHGVSRA